MAVCHFCLSFVRIIDNTIIDNILVHIKLDFAIVAVILIFYFSTNAMLYAKHFSYCASEMDTKQTLGSKACLK